MGSRNRYGIFFEFCDGFSVYPTAVLLGQPSGPTRVMSISVFTGLWKSLILM